MKTISSSVVHYVVAIPVCTAVVIVQDVYVLLKGFLYCTIIKKFVLILICSSKFQFHLLIVQSGKVGLCCLSCEFCCKPGAPCLCPFVCCGLTCDNDGCSIIDAQIQLFCLAITAAIPCNREGTTFRNSCWDYHCRHLTFCFRFFLLALFITLTIV